MLAILRILRRTKAARSDFLSNGSRIQMVGYFFAILPFCFCDLKHFFTFFSIIFHFFLMFRSKVFYGPLLPRLYSFVSRIETSPVFYNDYRGSYIILWGSVIFMYVQILDSKYVFVALDLLIYT